MMLRILLFGLITTPAFSQFLGNASFEGPPQMGIPPPGWKACNDYSTPDTQPGYWGINLPASHEKTYISLFTRGLGGFINDGYTEGIGTALSTPFTPNKCYVVSVDLAFFSKAIFVGPFGDVVTYENPVTLNVWGGNSECAKEVLFYQSLPVTHEQWKTYIFSITPQKQFSYLVLEAGYVDGQILYGSILVDNIRIESLEVELGEDKWVCQGASVPLQVSVEASTIEWNTGSTESSLTVTQSGLYSVEVTKGGCVLYDAISVQYLEPLNIDFGRDVTICPGDSIGLNATTPRGRYTWSNGSTLPTQTITTAGDYSVLVNNGCEQVEEGIEVYIDQIQCCNLSAPNIFTPNGDDKNEFFEMASPSTLQQYNLTIYNRWGRVVFESNDLNHFWDGNSASHQKVAEGVYFWIAIMSCSHKDRTFENRYRGTITLVR